MSKTLEEKCEEFCYRREELVRLAECLGDPVWGSHSDEWRSLLGDVTKSEVRKNRLQAISRQIVKLAVPGLKELVLTNKVRNDREIRKVEKIGRLATELVELLGEPNSYRSSYLTAFLETEDLTLEQRERDKRYSKSALVQELTLVAKGADEVKRVIKNSHHYHKANSKTATQDKFVDGLCFVWEQWTGATPGGSKEGGPAARFVMHAINPVGYSFSLNGDEMYVWEGE